MLSRVSGKLSALVMVMLSPFPTAEQGWEGRTGIPPWLPVASLMVARCIPDGCPLASIPGRGQRARPCNNQPLSKSNTEYFWLSAAGNTPGFGYSGLCN